MTGNASAAQVEVERPGQSPEVHCKSDPCPDDCEYSLALSEGSFFLQSVKHGIGPGPHVNLLHNASARCDRNWLAIRSRRQGLSQ